MQFRRIGDVTTESSGTTLKPVGYSAWWFIKLSGSLGLLAYVAAALLGYSPFAPVFSFPILAAQVIVVAGALTNAGHYLLLKRAAPRLSVPDALVTRGGLFGFVRNPMYLGDLLVMTGFLMLTPDVVSIMLYGVVALAIAKQCRVEEQGLRERFPEALAEWETRSRRLVPFIW